MTKKERLTRKEQESLDKLNLDSNEVTAWDFAKYSNISYTAAYELLESLSAKGILKSEWHEKGHKKKYKLVD